MFITRTSFRNGFYAGLLFAFGLGAYLFQLWQPDRQVDLHSTHFVAAVEQKDWSLIAEFIDIAYLDQWGEDRSLMLARLREVLRYARNLRLEARDTVAFASGDSGEWRARIIVSGDDNELVTMIKERVNPLSEPFHLQWLRQSWKPWDWKLTRVSNASLELPEL